MKSNEQTSDDLRAEIANLRGIIMKQDLLLQKIKRQGMILFYSNLGMFNPVKTNAHYTLAGLIKEIE